MKPAKAHRTGVVRRVLFPLAMLCLLAVSTADIVVPSAKAEIIERSLKELGLKQGFRLGVEQSGSVFLRVPSGAVLNGVRLQTYGNGVSTEEDAGTLRWFVNGVPADAMMVPRGTSSWELDRSGSIVSNAKRRGSALDGEARAVDVRYSLSLESPLQVCREPETVLAVAPSSRVLLDLDLSGVDDLSGALELLSPVSTIVLPSVERLSDATFSTALRVGLAVQRSGRRPLFVRERPDDAVSVLHIVSPGREGGAPVRLAKPSSERFDIMIDESGDLSTFIRLWESDPGLLMGGSAPRLSDGSPRSEGEPQALLRKFDRLPGAIEFGRRGEWALTFDLTEDAGGLPTSANLQLATAPDWSGEAPILTVFLNGQLIDAQRLNAGTAERLIVNLPEPLLQQKNVLRLVIDRAPRQNHCSDSKDGVFAQLLPGTGLTTGPSMASGFGAATHNYNDGNPYRIRVEQDALSLDNAKDHLTFLVDVLGGLNMDGSQTIIISAHGTGADEQLTDAVDLQVRPGDREGLTLELTQDAAVAGTLSFEKGTPFATATASNGRVVIDVPGDLEGYTSTRFNFLNGDLALLGSRGIPWQSGRAGNGVASSSQLFTAMDRMGVWLKDYGIIALIIILCLALFLIVVRESIARRSLRRRRTALSD